MPRLIFVRAFVTGGGGPTPPVESTDSYWDGTDQYIDNSGNQYIDAPQPFYVDDNVDNYVDDAGDFYHASDPDLD